MKPTIVFNAKPDGSAIAVPKSVPSKTMVEGAINSIPFRAAVQGGRMKIGKAVRDTAKVEITRVGDEPETRIPADLRKALAAAPMARASWADITPNARRDWIFSITTAKQAETRERRIAKALDMLECGKRRLCCFPGIKWEMKKDAKTNGMWMPLSTKK